MRLVYFGSGAFGLPTLARLAQTHDITGIVTQPDKPAGRGGKLTPTPIAAWAAEHLHAPILKPQRVNAPEVVAEIRRLAGSDDPVFVVIAFGQKLSQTLLDKAFAINLHASLLPRWRGAAPINAAILGGDSVTGNSIITLADRMDAGLVLAQSEPQVPIDAMVTAGELHDRLAAEGPELVLNVLAAHAAGSVSAKHQDESQVTIATKLTKRDGYIDFQQPAEFLRRQVHALTPWPGATTDLVTTSGAEPVRLKLLRVRVGEPGCEGEPGEVTDARRGAICCGNRTVLEVVEVQPSGKVGMDWGSFARGKAVISGSRFVSPEG